MFNKLKSIGVILFTVMFFFVYNNIVNGITMETLHDTWRYDDLDIPGETVNDYSITGVIKVVNNYLWLAIGFFCFLFAIINGYKLISAHGDEKKVKAATGGLIGSIVGIAICLSAYLIVNVVLKMFLT